MVVRFNNGQELGELMGSVWCTIDAQPGWWSRNSNLPEVGALLYLEHESYMMFSYDLREPRAPALLEV